MFPDKGPLRRELYPKHVAFFAAGSAHNERAMIAANRVGKTTAAGTEMTYHLTGKYPSWWVGKRFEEPVRAWAAGTTAKTTRDIIQDLLLGPPGNASAQGSGLIPADLIVRTNVKHGLPDCVETVYVRHASGGESSLQFKSFDQGRSAFEGTSQHVIWPDENVPADIYSEMLLRTMTTHGTILWTATLLELSPLLLQFMPELAPSAPQSGTAPSAAKPVASNKFAIVAGWDDVPHLDEKQKQALLASIPPHERDARTKGIPNLAAGAIYPVPEGDFTVTPFDIPPHWPRCYGLDVGYRVTACLWAAQDPLTHTVYITEELYRTQAEASVIAAAIRERGVWVPGVIDPAAGGSAQTDGKKVRRIYEENGLDIRGADNSVAAGITKVWQMLSQGQLKVFSSCSNLLKEYRVYRRDELGRIVDSPDHALDALRYLVMSGLERATVEPTQRAGGKRWCDWSPPHTFAG